MNEEHTLSLEELGEIKTVKVYSQAYVDKQQERIETLEKENAELKKDRDYFSGALDKQVEATLELHKKYQDLMEQNDKAKELIKNIIRVTWGEGWNYSLDWKVKAEQFLKGVSDYEIKKNTNTNRK